MLGPFGVEVISKGIPSHLKSYEKALQSFSPDELMGSKGTPTRAYKIMRADIHASGKRASKYIARGRDKEQYTIYNRLSRQRNRDLLSTIEGIRQ